MSKFAFTLSCYAHKNINKLFEKNFCKYISSLCCINNSLVLNCILDVFAVTYCCFELKGSPDLDLYNVVVLDEVHERHLTTDFLLGILKSLLKVRREMKLVLMSATINIHMFAEYFDNAPIVQVPGR